MLDSGQCKKSRKVLESSKKYLQYKVSVFDGRRTVDGIVGQVVVWVQHPQLFWLQHMFVPGLKYQQFLFFAQHPVLSNLHLSIIGIMKDIVEDFWLHITEHSLQPNHSEEIISMNLTLIFVGASDKSSSIIRNCVICAQWDHLFISYPPIPHWRFISGDVIKLLNIHSSHWNTVRNVKTAPPESRMNGLLFLLLNGSLIECKECSSRVCVQHKAIGWHW